MSAVPAGFGLPGQSDRCAGVSPVVPCIIYEGASPLVLPVIYEGVSPLVLPRGIFEEKKRAVLQRVVVG